MNGCFRGHKGRAGRPATLTVRQGGRPSHQTLTACHFSVTGPNVRSSRHPPNALKSPHLHNSCPKEVSSRNLLESGRTRQRPPLLLLGRFKAPTPAVTRRRASRLKPFVRLGVEDLRMKEECSGFRAHVTEGRAISNSRACLG